MKKLSIILALLVALALLLVACGGGQETPNDTTTVAETQPIETTTTAPAAAGINLEQLTSEMADYHHVQAMDYFSLAYENRAFLVEMHGENLRMEFAARFIGRVILSDETLDPHWDYVVFNGNGRTLELSQNDVERDDLGRIAFNPELFRDAFIPA